MTYARTLGLDEALRGEAPPKTPAKGHTYSSLARLDVEEHVEACSEVINDFVYDQLAAHPELAGHIGRVVGELHDNVASHSAGIGFSVAQYYRRQLELAIVDNGCGMLHNVSRTSRSIRDDESAIRWCLVRGNTTGVVDDMAQWLPPDAIASPYPKSVGVRRKENNHLGEGLWQLAELVRETRGELFIWSGNSRGTINESGDRFEPAPRWPGVAIEVTLPVVDGTAKADMPGSSGRLDALAKRLGIT